MISPGGLVPDMHGARCVPECVPHSARLGMDKVTGEIHVS